MLMESLKKIVGRILVLISIITLLFYPINNLHAAVQYTVLNAVSVNGDSQIFDYENTLFKTFHIIISGTATVTILISVDKGVTFIQLVPAVSVTSLIFTDVAITHFKANVASCSACVVTVKSNAERNV